MAIVLEDCRIVVFRHKLIPLCSPHNLLSNEPNFDLLASVLLLLFWCLNSRVIYSPGDLNYSQISRKINNMNKLRTFNNNGGSESEFDLFNSRHNIENNGVGFV